MHFFKISTKNPQKTTLFTRVSDGPKGNSVVCIAQKENSAKKILIKVGDLVGNEYFYDSKYADEIEANEELFAISREMFCADLIRTINPYCTPKYKRYYGKDLNELFIGSDFIEHFKTWKASYNYSAQTILGYKINSEGYVELPGNPKPVRGLGVCAVLLTVLGRGDRGNTNWGLVDLQVTLIDFGQCLIQFLLFEDQTDSMETNGNCSDSADECEKSIECAEECIGNASENVEWIENIECADGQGAKIQSAYSQGAKIQSAATVQSADGQGAKIQSAYGQAPANPEKTNSGTKENCNWLNFTNPFDIIDAVFQQYSRLVEPAFHTPPQQQYVEPPLPSQFLQSQHIKCEIFETIHQLHATSFSDIEKMANHHFKEFPLYKAAMLQDKKLVIDHLYNQFKDNKEYIAVQYINRCFLKLGTGFKLSALDNESIHYFLSVYAFINPGNDSYKEALFCKKIRTALKQDEPQMEMQEEAMQAPHF